MQCDPIPSNCIPVSANHSQKYVSNMSATTPTVQDLSQSPRNRGLPLCIFVTQVVRRNKNLRDIKL